MSRIRLFAISAVALVFLFGGASLVAAEWTAQSDFCGSCHEMEPYYSSWQASTHSGVDCVECHIPPGLVNYAETKMFGLREVYVHFTKQVKAPVTVTRDIADSTCTRGVCHDPGVVTLATSSFSHEAHGEAQCTDCHARMVHRSLDNPEYQDPATMAACFDCHSEAEANDECSYCHQAPHEDLGPCVDCHTLESWGLENFEHPLPLTGGHANLSCEQCHTGTGGGDTVRGLTLGSAPTECVDCHGDQHGGLSDCGQCHTPEGWTPANFSHPAVGEHIPGGEHRLACTDCHPSGFGSASCTPCHSGIPRDD